MKFFDHFAAKIVQQASVYRRWGVWAVKWSGYEWRAGLSTVDFRWKMRKRLDLREVALLLAGCSVVGMHIWGRHGGWWMFGISDGWVGVTSLRCEAPLSSEWCIDKAVRHPWEPFTRQHRWRNSAAHLLTFNELQPTGLWIYTPLASGGTDGLHID